MRKATTRIRPSGCAPRSPRSSCRCCRPTSSSTRTPTARTWSASRRSPASASASRRSGSKTLGRGRRSTCTRERSKINVSTIADARLGLDFYCLWTVAVHSRDDSGNFGRHINLHLTYSFQQQQGNTKSSLFPQNGNQMAQSKYLFADISEIIFKATA